MKNTGVKDSTGKFIKIGDILSIIHDSEPFGEAEFRRKVVFSKEHAAVMLVSPPGSVVNLWYLGELKNDVNYIRCKVVGTNKKLLDIPHGYPPGMTHEEKKKMFENLRNSRTLG